MGTNESINVYEKKLTSQNGEDGIIQEIFKRIGTTNKFFVEFGVEDGLQCNTAQLTAYRHWNGLLIEGNLLFFQKLKTNYEFFNIKLANRFITAENIVSVFQEFQVPKEFDLLSIDVDGNDYWIWKALIEYKPRVVIIEYNASYAPPIKWVMKYNPSHSWNGTCYFGASLASLEKLGANLGYSLIGTESKGVNAFFIRNDLLKASGFKARSAEEAFNSPNYGPFFGGHPFDIGPFEEI